MLFKHLMPRMHLLGISATVMAGRTAMAQVAEPAPATGPAICCPADSCAPDGDESAAWALTTERSAAHDDACLQLALAH